MSLMCEGCHKMYKTQKTIDTHKARGCGVTSRSQVPTITSVFQQPTSVETNTHTSSVTFNGVTISGLEGLAGLECIPLSQREALADAVFEKVVEALAGVAPRAIQGSSRETLRALLRDHMCKV